MTTTHTQSKYTFSAFSCVCRSLQAKHIYFVCFHFQRCLNSVERAKSTNYLRIAERKLLRYTQNKLLFLLAPICTNLGVSKYVCVCVFAYVTDSSSHIYTGSKLKLEYGIIYSVCFHRSMFSYVLQKKKANI